MDSLYSGSYKNIEILLVDNGSLDSSVDFARANYPGVKIVEMGENAGLAIASNQGASRAAGRYLFFYNNDTIADADLISRLASALEADAQIGIAGCETYTYDGKQLINAGVPCDIFGYPYGKTPPFYVDAAIFISKTLFLQVGGFDEKMFLYGEDRDLCWRVWLYGYKVAVVEHAKFFHDSACIDQDIKKYRTNTRKRFLGEFNALRSILKNYSRGFLIFILPLYFLVNCAEALAFLLRGKAEVVKNVYLRSYVENFRNLDNLPALRKKLQQDRKISDFVLLRHMDKIPGKLRLFFKIGIPEFNRQNKYAA